MNQLSAIATTALLLAYSGAAGQAPKTGATPSGNAQNGKRIYVSYGCYQCHGREGQGSAATGPRIGPRPIPFQVFLQYVRQPAGQMPPYTGKIVSDSELADIYAFLQARPQPPAVKNIPLLSN